MLRKDWRRLARLCLWKRPRGVFDGEDTKWVAKYGAIIVPAGVYIDKLISSYTNIVSQLDAEVKDPLKEQIDGVSVSQKITEDAQQQLHEYIGNPAEIRGDGTDCLRCGYSGD